MEPGSRKGLPSSSLRVWVKTQPSLASRVRAKRGKGFAQQWCLHGDEATEITRVELQSGIGLEVVRSGLIRVALASGAAHEPGYGRGASTGESERFVPWATPRATGSMVVVGAWQGDWAKEGLDLPATGAVSGFQRARWFLVWEECRVAVEGLKQSASISQQGRAQTFFEPLRIVSQTLINQARPGFLEESVGFVMLLPRGFFAEFFLALALGASSRSGAERRSTRVLAMVCFTNASASSVKR